MSRRSGNAPVPSRLHLNHTKRFILWFREFVIQDPSVNKNQIEKNKDETFEGNKKNEVLNDYDDKHDFSIAILKR